MSNFDPLHPISWTVIAKRQCVETQIRFDFDRICADLASRAAENRTGRARAHWLDNGRGGTAG